MNAGSVPILTSELLMQTIYSVIHSPMLYLLLGFVAMDFATGSAKALITGQFSSKIGINGLILHLLVLLLVVFLKFFGRLFSLDIAVYGMNVAFSVNYLASIIENFEAMGFKFPKRFTKGFKQMQKETDNEIVLSKKDEVIIRKNGDKKGIDR